MILRKHGSTITVQAPDWLHTQPHARDYILRAYRAMRRAGMSSIEARACVFDVAFGIYLAQPGSVPLAYKQSKGLS